MQEFELKNSRDTRVGILDYGGVITRIEVPDTNGTIGDVVLGFDDYSKYRDRSPYFGAIIGRYANRIASGKFDLEGKSYQLDLNNGPNSLHGGIQGFDKVYWNAEKVKTLSGQSIKLQYTSPDGDQGFPGNLECTVVYTLNEANELKIEYQAFTDKTTIINLTNHTYFNLNNSGGSDIRNHELEIHASQFTPVNEDLTPTGEITEIQGSPLDFLVTRTLGDAIDQQEEMGAEPGFDFNYVLDKEPNQLELVARVASPLSGRILEVLTTEPGMQFYTPPSLDIFGKGQKLYGDWPAFCLESQHFPDSPNQSHFPSVILRQGEIFKSTTIYRFKVL